MRPGVLVRVTGAAALVLIIIAAFLTLEFPNTSPVRSTSSEGRPVTVSTNEVTFFPQGAPFANLSFALWTLTVHNTSNRTQTLAASLFSGGYSQDFQDITLNSSNGFSQTDCMGPFPTRNRDFTMSVFVTSAAGATNFTVPVTTQTATQLPYSGQVSVTNTLRNTSATSPFPRGTGQWNMTVKNLGTNPIIFFYALLYGSNASRPIDAASSCPYPYGNLEGRQVSPQSPLLTGESTTNSSPFFSPGVIAGTTYQVYCVFGFAENTEVIVTTSVRAQ